MSGVITRGQGLAALALLLLSLPLSGCLALAGDEGTLGPVDACGSDLDCAEHGGRCDLSLNACVSAVPEVPAKLFIAVTDPSLALTSEHEIKLGGGLEVLRLELDAPVTVRGLVADEREGLRPLAAVLTFRRQSQLSGLVYEPVYAESVDISQVGEDGEPYNFQAQLMPGLYDLEVQTTKGSEALSQEATFYPLRESFEVVSAPLTLPPLIYRLDARQITSVVVDAAGMPLGGVRVYAFDAERQQAISEVATTVCEGPDDEACGRFTLTLSPEVNAFRLRLSGAEPGQLLPFVEHGDILFDSSDHEEPFGVITLEELGALRLPTLEEPVLYQNVVEGIERSGAASPLVGATLEIRTVVDPEHWPSDGTYTLQATTNELGYIVSLREELRGPEGEGIMLRPGRYQVTITPAVGGEYARGTTSITIASPLDELDDQPVEPLVVGYRARVSGLAHSPSGQPVPQVRVEATGQDGSSFVTTSDDLGVFSLLVDQGTYDLLYIPPAQTLLSWLRVLETAAFDDLDLSVEVGWGTPIAGIVVRAGGEQVVEGATVEAFVPNVEGAALELVPIARIRTAADGRFTFLAPTDLTD